MKVFGIDDDSEAFSLLITLSVGVILYVGTYLLNKKVMREKAAKIVS